MAAMVIESLQALKEFAGREFPASDWFLLTQERIQQFADATEDRQWIHLDRGRAGKESPYGTTIAHGFLTLSLISFFVKQIVEIKSGVRLAVNYGLNRVRFPSAVKSDTRIRARGSLVAVKELADGVEATYSVSVESEGEDKPCCVAEWIVRYYR